MGFALLILGLVLFLGVHVLTTRRDLRASLVARLGEGGYKAVYSVVAIIGVALAAKGFSVYRTTEWVDIWYPPKAMRHLTLALMLPAVILVVASYIRGRIFVKLKHPMLAGVKLWALAHLFANGDLGSIILFGSVLAWAVYDRISLKHRTDSGAPPIPVGGIGNDLIAVAVGIVAYLALAFAFHPLVIGVPVVGV
ncbi:MAG: NnrU family protein [Afipia felis]|nr:NnrU family protein [Afipia felis]